jgi:hypothetical protein
LGTAKWGDAMTADEVRHTAKTVMEMHGAGARTFAEFSAASLINDGFDDLGRSWRRVADVIRRRDEGLVKPNPLA